MLTELGLQKFDSLIDKCRNDFHRQIFGCDNSIVQYFVYLHLMWLIYVMYDCTAPFSLSLSVFLPYYFYVFYCSMGPVPEIKIDWLIDSIKLLGLYAQWDGKIIISLAFHA